MWGYPVLLLFFWVFAYDNIHGHDKGAGLGLPGRSGGASATAVAQSCVQKGPKGDTCTIPRCVLNSSWMFWVLWCSIFCTFDVYIHIYIYTHTYIYMNDILYLCTTYSETMLWAECQYDGDAVVDWAELKKKVFPGEDPSAPCWSGVVSTITYHDIINYHKDCTNIRPWHVMVTIPHHHLFPLTVSLLLSNPHPMGI